MNKKIGILIIGSFFMCVSVAGHASDWDTAGKILTGVEGLRVLTGGRVDLIGSMTGINKSGGGYYTRQNRRWNGPQNINVHHCTDACKRWVPQYVSKRRWVPMRVYYDHYSRRQITVPAHYETYQVERGGYWVYDCQQRHNQYREYSCTH